MKYSHNINDFCDIQDDLDRLAVARQIANELFDASAPGVIGVYGSWGSGKSHLLSQSIAQIFERNATSTTKLIVCTFDAWRYELEGDLAVGLIKSLQNVEKQAVGHNPVLSGTQFKEVADLLLYALSEVAEYAIPAGKLVSTVAKIAGRALTAATEGAGREPASDTDARVDVIRARMRELVSAILSAAQESDSGGSYRLVVFVDDLDRCSPENMVRMFEWLKVHLSWTPKFEPLHLCWKLVLILPDEEVQEYGQEGEVSTDGGSGRWARRSVQGARGVGCLQRRQDTWRAGGAVRCACHADLDLEAAALGRGCGFVRGSASQAAGRGEQPRGTVRADRSPEDGGRVVEKKICPVRLTRVGPGSSRGMAC